MMLKLITKAPSIARSFSSTISETQPEKILIIGGGIMGSATAYWLKLRAGNKANVTVLEKSPMARCLSHIFLNYLINGPN